MEGSEGRVCQFSSFNQAALYAADVRTVESLADRGELGGPWRVGRTPESWADRGKL